MYNKLSIGFDCLGQQSLKNVANPVTGYRVLQGGAATPARASRPDVRREPATPPRPAHHAQAGLSPAWGWYSGLPRLAAVMIALAVFMFLINVFSGLNHIWFHWPAALLLLIAILLGRDPAETVVEDGVERRNAASRLAPDGWDLRPFSLACGPRGRFRDANDGSPRPSPTNG